MEETQLSIATASENISLQSEERAAGEVEVYVNGLLKGYASLYPLTIIIALSYQLDSMEAHFFRKHVCQRLQKPTSIITPIFLIGKTDT